MVYGAYYAHLIHITGFIADRIGALPDELPILKAVCVDNYNNLRSWVLCQEACSCTRQ